MGGGGGPGWQGLSLRWHGRDGIGAWVPPLVNRTATLFPAAMMSLTVRCMPVNALEALAAVCALRAARPWMSPRLPPCQARSSAHSWPIARRLPPLTTSSRNWRTTAAGSPALTSDGPRSSGGFGSGLVEDGGDPAGGPAKGQVAEGGGHVDEGVVAFGPDVQVGVAAGQLPALGHQDGLIAQRVQGTDGEQGGRQTGQVVQHR